MELLTRNVKCAYNLVSPLGLGAEEARMFRALAVSLTPSNFIMGDDGWIVDPQVAGRLDGFAERFGNIYNDVMNGWAHQDDIFETEQDGTYDKFGNIIVHWRNDGFVDFVVFDSPDAAKREWSDIAGMYERMPNGKTF
jgi:hypothetical protein